MPLTGEHFIQFLRVFGYKWVDDEGNDKKPTDDVTMVDLFSMVMLFDGVKLTTPTEFNSFIERFDFKELYAPTTATTPRDIMEEFGFFVRSLHQLRDSNPDGQHRTDPMVQLLHGHCILSANAPMPKHDFKQLAKKVKGPTKMHVKDMPCWNSAEMKIIML